MSDLGILGIIAAAVAAGWSYIRSFVEAMKGLFIVTVQLDPAAAAALTYYLTKHARKTSAAKYDVYAMRQYVRPQKRVRWVGVKTTPVDAWFFLDGAPLRVHTPEKTHMHNASAVSYLRGTLNFYDLLEKAFVLQSTPKTDRYQIVPLTGKEMQQSKENARLNIHTDSRIVQEYCVWSNDDVGAQVRKEPFSALALSTSLQLVFKEATAWLEGEEWYEKRGVPWRYSMLLWGKPGTGKTSFVRAMAQSLDLPVYVFDIVTMSNQELTENWSTAASNAPCIVLFEDIDRAFDDKQQLRQPTEHKTLTLDCLLNCISGVDQSHGIITVLTANNKEALDPALLRPGRVDVHVEVGGLTKEGKQQIARRILEGHPEEVTKIINMSEDNETGAVFERRCQERAVQLFRAVTVAQVEREAWRDKFLDN